MYLGFLFNLLAYLVGAGVFFWASRRSVQFSEYSGRLIMIAILSASFGARLTQLLAQGWPFSMPASAAFDFQDGGRALLGGLVFGWIGVEIAKWRYGIKQSYGEPFALALAAGEAVGRIGCYFNGCCYGTECSLPWAIDQHGALRHPSQIYSSITALGIFIALLFYRRRLEGSEAHVIGTKMFRAYLLMFGVTRFFVEFTRERGALIAGLSPMQWFCLEIVVVMVVARFITRSKPIIAH